MTEDAGEKKIIIDEDWKNQVEAEREEVGGQQDAPGEQDAPASGQMPPASFDMLITTMATEAMVSLGQMPHPGTGQAAANLDHARYFIDTLEVLKDKTKGNLTKDEDAALEGLVHQLKLAYVAVKKQADAAGVGDSSGESSVVTP